MTSQRQHDEFLASLDRDRLVEAAMRVTENASEDDDFECVRRSDLDDLRRALGMQIDDD